VQVVGQSCAVCGARIVMAREGQACASCAAAVHTACAAGHTCAVAAPPAPAVPAPIPRKRRLLTALVPLLGVLVAAGGAQRIRSWQTKRQIAERAAHRLGCSASGIEVSWEKSGITARGCGTWVTYLRVCGNLDQPECLEEIQLPAGR